MLDIKPPLFVTVDGRKLAYDEISPPHPQGTVLLLTGLAATRLGWSRQMAAFGQRYRTLAIDHRDAGDSDPFPGPYTTADQAEDAAAVLKALGIAHAAVAGISMGGFIALELTLRHPDLVDRLVLTSTSAGGRAHVRPRLGLTVYFYYLLLRNRRGEPGERARRIYMRIMAPGYLKSHPDDLLWIMAVARYRLQSAAEYRRQVSANRTYDVVDRLGQIHVPTLVIHGAVDPLVRVENGRYLAEHIPGARLIIYPDTGHIPIIERSTNYNRDVLTFLGDTDL